MDIIQRAMEKKQHISKVKKYFYLAAAPVPTFFWNVIKTAIWRGLLTMIHVNRDSVQMIFWEQQGVQGMETL